MKKGKRNEDMGEKGRKEIALKRPVAAIGSEGIGLAQEIKPTLRKEDTILR